MLAPTTPSGHSYWTWPPTEDWKGGWSHGADPERRDCASFAHFADPDGNTWVLQEIGHRVP